MSQPSNLPATAVVVGNPKPDSRTLAAARYLARELSGAEPALVVDLATLGPAVLDWQDETVADLVARVGAADLAVFASPTYKGTYTGLLKLFSRPVRRWHWPGRHRDSAHARRRPCTRTCARTHVAPGTD